MKVRFVCDKGNSSRFIGFHLDGEFQNKVAFYDKDARIPYYLTGRGTFEVLAKDIFQKEKVNIIKAIQAPELQESQLGEKFKELSNIGKDGVEVRNFIFVLHNGKVKTAIFSADQKRILKIFGVGDDEIIQTKSGIDFKKYGRTNTISLNGAILLDMVQSYTWEEGIMHNRIVIIENSEAITCLSHRVISK